MNPPQRRMDIQALRKQLSIIGARGITNPLRLAGLKAPDYPLTISKPQRETVSMPETRMTEDLPTNVSYDVAMYLATALFTDVEEHHPEARVKHFTIESFAFAQKTFASMRELMAKEFSTEELTYIHGACDLNPGVFGSDLWYSTNGHGTGFWDRDEVWTKSLGNRLHELAKKLAFHGMVYYNAEANTAEICA